VQRRNRKKLENIITIAAAILEELKDCLLNRRSYLDITSGELEVFSGVAALHRHLLCRILARIATAPVSME
jgi:hypothetical protein